MSKISFSLSSEPEKPQKKRAGALTVLLCLTAGVCAILQIICAAGDIFKEAWSFCPPALAICSTIWYMWFYQRNLFPLTVAAGTVVTGAAVFLLRDTLYAQITQLTAYFLIHPVVDQPSPHITETILLLIFPLALILFFLELLFKNHMLLYLLTTTLFLFCPFFRTGFSFATTILILFFQVTFWVLQWSGGIRLFKDNGSTKAAVRGHTCIRLTAGFLLLCVIAGLTLTDRYHLQLFTLGDAAAGFFQRTASRLSGQDRRPVTGGKIKNGNSYPTGAGHLELRLSRQPSEPLYLRGFSGGEYLGGDWTAADDEELLPGITEAFQNMYLSMNRRGQEPAASEPFSVTVRHLSGAYDQEYVPYYSWRNHDDSPAEDGYGYSFFEQKDMNFPQEQISPEPAPTEEQYRRLQQAYLEKIQAVYTRVPRERLPRLTALAAKYPLNNLHEISTFILAILHQNAAYTSSPGVMPQNCEIAEYFLYVSGCGYCQHFALTATLLYRLYGVPARYAAGYRVEPSAFTLQEDGSWQAVATDRNAHAWVEIFLEDYGWTPVEATPAADGTTVASYPGYNNLIFQQVLSLWGQNNEASSPREPPVAPVVSIQSPAEALSALWSDLRSHEKLWKSIQFCLLYMLLSAPVLIGCRRLWKLKRIKSMSCRRVYARLTEMLHYSGLLLTYDGSEKEFAKVLSGELRQLPPEDIVRMWDTVCRAAYSPEYPSEENEELVRNVYRHAAETVYEGLSRRRKLLFRYWKVFI